jgi:RNA polymerase sigma-70 factor (ECF subfamily)
MTAMATDDPLRHLVEAAVEGDDIAVAELVRRTQASVDRICTLLGSGDDVDDLVQDTYVRALRSLSGYRAEAPVETWLLSIARRVCADQVRRAQRERRLLDRLRRHPAPAVAEGPATNHPDTLLIDSLDVDRREAFVLTQLAGLSYEEAAAVAGCPVGTIRSRVARARADLQRAMRRADAS